MMMDNSKHNLDPFITAHRK